MSFNNLTIAQKIAVGFGSVLVFLCAVVILSYTGVRGIVLQAGHVIDGNKLDALLAQKEVDHLNWSARLNALLTDVAVTELKVQTDHHKCALGQWLYGEGRRQTENSVPRLAPLLKAIEMPHEKLHASAIAIGKTFRQADPGLPALFQERHIDHLNWAARIRDAFLNDEDELGVQTDPTKCALGKWIVSERARSAYANGDREFQDIWNKMVKTHEALHRSAVMIEQLIGHSNQEARQVFRTETMPLLSETVSHLKRLREKVEHDLEGMREADHIFATETLPALSQVRGLLGDIRKTARANIMTDDAMLAMARSTQRNVTIVGVIAILSGLSAAFFIARGIVRVLSRITHQMEESADQVASASGQVASASQALAEGASEQAASIEETSSALEQMSSMTRQNAANANQANTLMKEANQVVESANTSMRNLTQSMDAIASASEETSKIIKTIDEIAFQTNLLALNAAVEAARAGEAGAGFAVVADEVRNLAMRAADAAKNTSDLIEGTVKKVEDGSALVSETDGAFSRVAEDVAKVGELVSEINVASNEQAQGIGQINRSVTEMDRVTQQNAASAEESASASEQMSAQSMQMKDIVNRLMAMVGGNGRHRRHGAGARIFGRSLPVPTRNASEVKARTPRYASETAARHKIESQGYGSGKVNPEDVIPMDDDQFEDF